MADFLSTLFGGGAEAEAADKNRALLAQYGPQAQGYLTTGYNTGTDALGNAVGAFAPLATLGTKYNAAGDLLTGALGAGGKAGTDAAAAAFTNAPGYTGAVTAGLDAINRRRAAMGMADSGNADQDAQTFGQNLENTQYNTWLQNLQNVAGMGVNATGAAATGQAGGYTSLANLAQNYAGNQVGVAGNVLSGNVNANDFQAAGEAAGAKNLLGAGLSLATAAMGGPIGAAIGGGITGAFGGGGTLLANSGGKLAA